MLIEKVDFVNTKRYRGLPLYPVFLRYKDLYFEIPFNSKKPYDSWAIAQKLFYFYFTKDNEEYFESILNVKSFGDRVIFADKTFYFANDRSRTDDAIKINETAYMSLFTKPYNCIFLMFHFALSAGFDDFTLYIADGESIKTQDFKNEYKKLINQFKRKHQIKKGNLVLGHINGIILTDKEKLFLRISSEFDKKVLLGDIVLNSDEDKILKEFMKEQFDKRNNSWNPNSFSPDYPKVFALGLVRFSMKYYNAKHSGDFWTHFQEEYGFEAAIPLQNDINSFFRNLMLKYKKPYIGSATNKIDNINMHAFVADNSSFQLFDYLFAFWKIDLKRNAKNLNTDDGKEFFEDLIASMQNGVQNVMAHTSLLLESEKTKKIFKTRVKRILKMMDGIFWGEETINLLTGNRINALLKKWIENGTTFKKEKDFVKRKTGVSKGEALFHKPRLRIDVKTASVFLDLPFQRLLSCSDSDNPVWEIRFSDDQQISTRNAELHKDRIGFYIDKVCGLIPLDVILKGIKIKLVSNGKTLKTYSIKSADERFFDANGFYVDHETSILPTKLLYSLSNGKDYPEILGEKNESFQQNGIFIKRFVPVDGQIMVLTDGRGIEIGEKLAEGFIGAKSIGGSELIDGDVSYPVFSSLPKIYLSVSKDEFLGIGLSINGDYKRLSKLNYQEFKVQNDLNLNGYLFDLSEYIKDNGIYSIRLTFPNKTCDRDLGMITYIQGFGYSFEKDKYIFESEATIFVTNNIKFDKTEHTGCSWSAKNAGDSLTFNFGERKKESPFYCDLVEDRHIVLKCTLNGKEYELSFSIPALFWRFSDSNEWNTERPSNIRLKDFRENKTKLYISGPFDLKNAYISTEDDVDIAEEESTIACIASKKENYFETDKIYNWFNNDRTKQLRKVYLTIDGEKTELFSVICKSKLHEDSLHLAVNHLSGTIKGFVDIEGDESYTATIKHDGQIIGEDIEIKDGKFELEHSPDNGLYYIDIYETIDDDSDGFDVDVSSIKLNSAPIVRRILNLNGLEGSSIHLMMACDKRRILAPFFLIDTATNGEYVVKNLRKTTYDEMMNNDLDVIEIWNENIDTSNENEMSSFIYYYGEFGTLKKNTGEFSFKNDVLIVFPDDTNQESMILLCKEDDSYYDFILRKIVQNRYMLVSPKESENYSSFIKRKCKILSDDDYYLKTTIEGM